MFSSCLLSISVLPESIHDVILDEGELGVNLEHPGAITRSQRRPGNIDVVGHCWGWHTCLGKVGQERSEDVTREFGIAGRHLQVFAPDPVEDILEVVAMSHSHVHLVKDR